MAKQLKNVTIDEFSLVRGPDLQPANPECTVAFYKAQTAKESNGMDKENVAAAATPAKEPLAKTIAAAVKTAIAKAKRKTSEAAPAVGGAEPIEKTIAAAVQTAIEKATSKRTSTYSSQSVDVYEEPDPVAGEGVPPTVVVVTDAVEKTEPAAEPGKDPVAKTAPATDVDAIVAALEPIAKAITAIDGRVLKIEKASVGSRVVKAASLQTGVTVTDNSDQKFPEFTKFLAARSGLSAGQRLTKATLTSAGWTYGLSGKEADNFIDYIVDQSVLLKQCRTIPMPDKKYNIDKIGLGSKVFKKGTPGVDPGDTVSVNNPSQVQLDAEEVIAIVSVGDDTLEDNIEGEAFVQHLLGMVGRAGSNELEQMAIHADKDVADDYILDRLDGWLKLAKAAGAHVIDAMEDDDRYWPGTAAKKATRLIKALPTKYRNDMRNLALILAPDAYLDYNDMLAELGYGEAFAAITGIKDVPVRSVRNVQVPMLKTDIEFASGGQNYADGTVQILTDLRNLIFGIHRQIKIEPQRQARKRATDYVLSMRCAAQIENGDAIAIYDHSAIKAE